MDDSNGNSFGVGDGGPSLIAGRGGLRGERRDTETTLSRLQSAIQPGAVS